LNSTINNKKQNKLLLKQDATMINEKIRSNNDKKLLKPVLSNLRNIMSKNGFLTILGPDWSKWVWYINLFGFTCRFLK
jgi:hypothetical protein